MSSNLITIQSITIPKVGFGTYQLTGNEGIRSVEDALQTGYRHIDTAQAYDNEEEVGKAIMNSGINRQEIFITTKVWPSDFRRLLPAVEDSLRKLKVDHVDLLLLHWPSDDEANKMAVDLLNQAFQKNYAKSIGVSNFNMAQLAKSLTQAPLICNQVEYHPFLSQQKMLAYLKEQNMFLTAYSPLALGKVMKDETLQALAKKYGKTTSQIALRWLVQQGDIAVIPKASSKERRKENLDIFDFELFEEDMKTIFQLNKGQRLGNPAWAPKWD
jgi:2,5-diketo-D-gluconate reductase B